jgi:SAM-dependent methyltransferase
MIDDLGARRRHWDDPVNRAPRDEHDLEDSLPYPFGGLENLFFDKDVLEIGPGRGRQYERLRGLVKSYSLCDISTAALAEPVFDGARAKYWLYDYSDDFFTRFDLIHFWYVLHHIRRGELEAFFAFVARHLREAGVALFNSPQTGNNPDWYTGDGMGTTYMTSLEVVHAFSPFLTIVEVCEQDDRSSGALFVTRKL